MLPELGHGKSRSRLLIVDDDPIFTTMASSCLAAAGFETRIAGDGVEALELLESEHFDVALVDIAMPRVDGLRLIGLLRSTPRLKQLAILVISSRKDPGTYEEALALGANAFHTKPVNWSLLPVHIRYVMHSAKQPT